MTQSGTPQDQPEDQPQDQPQDQGQDELWQSDAGPASGAAPGAPVPTPPAASGSTGPAPGWTQTLTSTSAEPGPAGFYFADVPNRIIAHIIDLILLALVGFILALALGGLFGGLTTSASLDSAGGDLNTGAFVAVSLAQLAVSFAYFAYFWTASRATSGMKLLGLQIGDETDGHSIDWNQATIRWLILGIPSILSTFASYVSNDLGLILSVVGLAWLIILLYSVAKSPTKQGLHDRYARTIVVKARRRAA